MDQFTQRQVTPTVVHFLDGVVTEAKLSEVADNTGQKSVKVMVNEEEVSIPLSDTEKYDIKVGKHIRGFVVESYAYDDGTTIFYFDNFYPA
ncbi:hypothetical protein EPO05_04190 [Patescibacteria group bacterium]|nr:MAG: hypothetical protein EPO05_04190 [Patescibacteria group bacterium]